jgi:hypothetical protein
MGKSQRTGQLVAEVQTERPNGGKRMPYMDMGLRLPEKEEEPRLTRPCTLVCLGAI